MSDIKDILKESGFRFNKQFGQNFITDVNLLGAMVSDAGITGEDTVIEIGPGAGTLTRSIANVAKKVVSFEIDRNLEPILKRTLSDHGNAEVIFKDFQKVSDAELRSILDGGEYKVVANLPYYITTPLVMRFLESEYKPSSVTVMVQKEVAERFIATEKSDNYGVISLAIALEGDAKLTRIVSRNLFYPVPNVDSAIVNIAIRDKGIEDKEEIKKIVKAAFSMRRKTLVNNLTHTLGLTREDVESALLAIGKDVRERGETLSLDEYVALKDALSSKTCRNK